MCKEVESYQGLRQENLIVNKNDADTGVPVVLETHMSFSL